MSAEVRLTSLDRVLWPATGFTKRDLVDYYTAVAEVLLPHLAGRPVTLGRFPGGIDGPGFAQTECRGRPDWMATKRLTLRSGEVREFCLVQDLASLLWVANQATIELHPYLGGGDAGEDAVLALFDLDPGAGAGPLDVARVALRLWSLLEEAGLASFPKASGGLGMHVYVPLNVPHRYEAVRAYCDEVAGRLPDAAVRVDCAQNHPRRSMIAPYSLRAADTPTVSAPLAWEEVAEAVAARRPELLLFAAERMPERVAERGDPFRPVLELEQRLAG
jgi:bifunctional non-homologous end joining protein LigD